MKQRFTVLALACVLLFSLAACNSSPKPEPQTVSGAVNAPMQTTFFTYTVLSAELVDEYNGYTAPQTDQALALVRVSLQNITDDPQSLYDSDFTLTWEGGNAWCADTIEGAEAMLPKSTELATGQAAEYELLFVLPQGQTAPALVYTETFASKGSEDTVQSTYTVLLTL